jgi:hypothetical protein
VKIAPILTLVRGEDKRHWRRFARLCSCTDRGIQHDPNRKDSSIRQRHQRRRQWQKAEAVSCVYWRCSRRRSDNRRQMNTTDKVGEENNERIVIDNEMMDYE